MTPHISTVLHSERITTWYGNNAPQRVFSVQLDCGHRDTVEAGMRRRCPTVVRCTQCEREQQEKQ